MLVHKLLIANRGEVAIRVARSAADFGVATVGVYSEDDAAALHRRRVDDARPLTGRGPTAYLDAAQLIDVARTAECDAVHPGYGFLSENAGFARAVAAAGMTFVGPPAEVLDRFGDKTGARSLARSLGIPVLAGTDGPATLEEAQEVLAAAGSVMVKAVAGGGGRGMRPASSAKELDEAFTRCASEAQAAFGDPRLYVEALLPRARHVEVQLAGDGHQVVHLWDRECSLQRQRQKVVEIAPALGVPESIRRQLRDAAVALAKAAGVANLCTVEFLVHDAGFAFIEANPRLQVEHTVTEEVTALDLVLLQLQLASGASLESLGLAPGTVPPPSGVAIQARVNLETMGPDGTPRPGVGRVTVYEPPTGPGVRVDGAGYTGWDPPTSFDSLVAKVIVHRPGGSLAAVMAKARRALSEFQLEGPACNLGFLQRLLSRPEVVAGQLHTRFIDEHVAELAEPELDLPPPKDVQADPADPLAVLTYGQTPGGGLGIDIDKVDEPDGMVAVRTPVAGTVVAVEVRPGDAVAAAQPLLVVESMKMEHLVAASGPGVVREVLAAPRQTLSEGQVVVHIQRAGPDGGADDEGHLDVDVEWIRPDLAEVLERHHKVLDEARPDAVARRHDRGKRTVRENLDDLCDPGTFTEYGPLVVAGRFGRNTLDELIDQTPADGLVMGLGQINGKVFGPERSRAAVLAYDYTVLAGTQGARNHVKLDRMAELARRWQLPTVFLTEGGGGRPGDTDRGPGFIRGFEYWAQLSGAVPLIGVTSGRCFAGNAAILGCCDVIIATRDSALGMGGPAMVEGGGLGVFRPEEIGPVPVMQANGVIDVLVEDEAAAIAAAKQYLSYFQGRWPDWSCADQRLLRHAIPEQRLRAYDIRRLIHLLADSGSVMELRPRFGRAMVTALVRIEGHPMGLIANNPAHLGGAIDSDASDKAARLMQLCEAFGLPLLSLSDTPGNMVGPEAEKTGLIRHCSRMFVIGANLSVPIFSIILRKSYGLGAIAMTGGSYQASMFCVSWPTGEFGGMGVEGSVKLGYRKELAAIEDPAQRKAEFDRMVAQAYAAGRALSRAVHPGLDDVIDPADTRRWITAGLRSLPPPEPRRGKRVPWVDAW